MTEDGHRDVVELLSLSAMMDEKTFISNLLALNRAQLSRLKYRNSVCQCAYFAQIVGRKQDRYARRVRCAQHLFDMESGLRVKPAEGLVQDQQLGLDQHARHQSQLLGHAFGVSPAWPLQHIGRPFKLRCVRVPSLPVQGGHMAQEGGAGQERRRGKAFRKLGKVLARRGQVVRMAVDVDGAGVGANEV